MNRREKIADLLQQLNSGEIDEVEFIEDVDEIVEGLVEDGKVVEEKLIDPYPFIEEMKRCIFNVEVEYSMDLTRSMPPMDLREHVTRQLRGEIAKNITDDHMSIEEISVAPSPMHPDGKLIRGQSIMISVERFKKLLEHCYGSSSIHPRHHRYEPYVPPGIHGTGPMWPHDDVPRGGMGYPHMAASPSEFEKTIHPDMMGKIKESPLSREKIEDMFKSLARKDIK